MKYIAIKGASEAGKPVAQMPGKPHKRGIYLVSVGTDTAKELIYERYGQAERGPGYCHYATEEHGYTDTYFEQATAEKKVKRYKKGQQYYEWVKENTARNEALDIRVYNLAAVRLLQQAFGVKLTEKLAKSPETQQTAPQDTPAIEQVRQSRVIKRKRGGFVNRYRGR